MIDGFEAFAKNFLKACEYESAAGSIPLTVSCRHRRTVPCRYFSLIISSFCSSWNPSTVTRTHPSPNSWLRVWSWRKFYDILPFLFFSSVIYCSSQRGVDSLGVFPGPRRRKNGWESCGFHVKRFPFFLDWLCVFWPIAGSCTLLRWRWRRPSLSTRESKDCSTAVWWPVRCASINQRNRQPPLPLNSINQTFSFLFFFFKK